MLLLNPKPNKIWEMLEAKFAVSNLTKIFKRENNVMTFLTIAVLKTDLTVISPVRCGIN